MEADSMESRQNYDSQWMLPVCRRYCTLRWLELRLLFVVRVDGMEELIHGSVPDCENSQWIYTDISTQTLSVI